MILTGALINGAAIVAGGVVGTFGGKLMPQRMKETVLAATALISIGIGVSGLGSSNNQLRITEGFVTGSLVFAVGAMAVMGALDSGLKNDHTVLLAKSVIDGTAAIAFAGSLGIGVAFSGASVLLVEGLLALLASLVAPLLTGAVLFSAVFLINEPYTCAHHRMGSCAS